MKEPILVVACGITSAGEDFVPVPVVYHKKGLSIARGMNFRLAEPQPTRYWRVYHQKSGLAFGYIYGETISESIKAVNMLARVRGLKWTWSAERLGKHQKALRKAREAAQTFGGIR